MPIVVIPRGLIVAVLAAIAMGVAAQGRKPLNLKLQPVTEGTVAAIQSVDAANTRILRPDAQARGPAPADLASGPPVGAVAAMPLGKESDHKWKFGAAGTSAMKPYLDGSAQEIVVQMDDGERRTFRPRDPARFRLGQRVTVQTGELEPLALRREGG